MCVEQLGFEQTYEVEQMYDMLRHETFSRGCSIFYFFLSQTSWIFCMSKNVFVCPALINIINGDYLCSITASIR